jgi:PIN domain nuclease of toxin-antitoxin system
VAARVKVILDTHATVWWASSPEVLGPSALDAIAEAEVIAIPSIVFWEISLLVRRGRLRLELPLGRWAERLLAVPRCRSVPLDVATALLADSLVMHADPADRFIVATALQLDAPLITKDDLIRSAGLVRTLW